MSKVEFLFSKLTDIPELKLPEVALIGRSNVGKSSLLNHMLSKKKLAKVSSTPGKTQMLNFFNFNDELTFVDLPGYGFANVPPKVRKVWDNAIHHYLTKRPNLKLLLVLLDSRRDLTKLDADFIAFAIETKLPLLLVFTKCDKLKPREVKTQVEKNLEKIAPHEFPYATYSIKTPHSKTQLLELIYEQCFCLR
ncbi:MAG: GTP-binding protein EngB [Chlamydiia bacterium]|nr:GTP-binding protein EngB [Chlamydiia bacterium]MCH9616488.1 GTP-binding protein EngB [Chlamydiia bacterium]MCH9629526.1 GTP-binding protein EngB [Chlamydiia bacterium]